MKYRELKKLGNKLYFNIEDLTDLFGIKPESARVLCSRYVKNGLFLRLKKNFYVLDQKWETFTREDFFRISNFLQVPSYVSVMTALSWHGVTTQVQRNFFEGVSLKRSVRFDAQDIIFNFYKFQKSYYFGFIQKDNIFIATKEKAFIDAVYLYSFGKYKFDSSSLDLSKLDKHRIKKMLEVFPRKTKDIAKTLCKI